METIWCLAGVDPPMTGVFRDIGTAIEPSADIRRVALDVALVGRMRPRVLVCDVDAVDVDPLEMLRRMRFVLPECTIVSLTGRVRQAWAAECHLAGATCLLAKLSSPSDLEHGVRTALRAGCYTDPAFALAAVG